MTKTRRAQVEAERRKLFKQKIQELRTYLGLPKSKSQFAVLTECLNALKAKDSLIVDCLALSGIVAPTAEVEIELGQEH